MVRKGVPAIVMAQNTRTELCKSLWAEVSHCQMSKLQEELERIKRWLHMFSI